MDIAPEKVRENAFFRGTNGHWAAMKISDFSSRYRTSRTLALLTILAIVILASHPELRLLIPFVDALGIDLFAVLLGAQIWDYVRPELLRAYRLLALPAAQKIYAFTIYFLGIAGPYADEIFRTRFPGCELRPNNSLKPTPLRGAA